MPPELFGPNRPDIVDINNPVTISDMWWEQCTARHLICTGRKDQILVFDSSLIMVDLVHRPKFGPFDAEYRVGDSVLVHVDGTGTIPGIVTMAIHQEISGDEIHSYTVETIRGIEKTAGPEDMCRSWLPKPQVGQQWVALSGRERCTVVKAEGLVADVRFDSTDRLAGITSRVVFSAESYGLLQPWPDQDQDHFDVITMDVLCGDAGKLSMPVRVYR